MAAEDTMDLIAECVEVWAASIEDKPGSLAHILAGLREAGADLNCQGVDRPATGLEPIRKLTT